MQDENDKFESEVDLEVRHALMAAAIYAYRHSYSLSIGSEKRGDEARRRSQVLEAASRRLNKLAYEHGGENIGE